MSSDGDFSLAGYVWTEHPASPLIEPPRPEWLLGDPTVCPPERAPDGRWHLFANTLRGIHHFVSADGILWGCRRYRLFPGMRAFLFYEDGYVLFYERFLSPFRSRVEMRRSRDLDSWSEPAVVLEPSLPWEIGRTRNLGNPCVVRADGGYRLYYSANIIFLRDCKFPEPRHVGVAESERLEGPYRKRTEPILSPSPATPFRNLGAGSLKVYREGTAWVGYNNGIYRDRAGRSRSDIRLLTSPDGISWEYAGDDAIVAPEPGWKQALVYAMDVVPRGDERWLYFNARDGWMRGSERIGLVIGRPTA